jgi:DNA-binding transcriptional ArsR family regulator
MFSQAELESRFAEAQEAETLHRFGYAFTCATRVRVLLALRESPDTPSGIAQSLGISRQMVSNQLACLRTCGLVSAAGDGRNRRYRLADPLVGRALDAMFQAGRASVKQVL